MNLIFHSKNIKLISALVRELFLNRIDNLSEWKVIDPLDGGFVSFLVLCRERLAWHLDGCDEAERQETWKIRNGDRPKKQRKKYSDQKKKEVEEKEARER